MDRRTLVVTLCWLLICGTSLEAAVKVAWGRNEEGSSEFEFKDVASPSKVDLGNRATFSVAGGRVDGNSGGLATLNDGRWPGEADEPSANFFFAPNTEGGRVLVDLREATEVKRINTYSWHPGGRGPQVYKVYGHESSGDGAKENDLSKAGWTLIASVDTRPKEGQAGGQYGVSIEDDAGGGIGKYRYLVFVVSRTSSEDPFGNTFFSEIDVIDGKEYPPAVAAMAAPPFTVKVDGKYEITFDVSEVPELKEWVETKLRPVCVEWYPKIVEMLPSEGFTAPARFSITFRKEMRGVAFASGGRITCAGEWFKRNLDGEAAGAVVHELVHIVQQYGRGRGAGNPGWLVEGLADYIRWFLYEPESLRPRVDPARAKYTDSYRTTGAFLNYLMEKHDGEIVKKLNAAMREGRYTAEIWTTLTGKTVEELWGEYVKTLKAP